MSILHLLFKVSCSVTDAFGSDSGYGNAIGYGDSGHTRDFMS
jgi:hypothetical protein